MNIENLGDSNSYLSFYSKNYFQMGKVGSINLENFRFNGSLPSNISFVNNNNEKFQDAFLCSYNNDEYFGIANATIKNTAIASKKVINKILPINSFKPNYFVSFLFDFYSFKSGYFIFENNRGYSGGKRVLSFVDEQGNSQVVNNDLEAVRVENDTAFLVDTHGKYQLKYSTDGKNWTLISQSETDAFYYHSIKFVGNKIVVYSYSNPIKKLEIFDLKLNHISTLKLDEPISINDIVEANNNWYIIGENGVYYLDLQKVT